MKIRTLAASLLILVALPGLAHAGNWVFGPQVGLSVNPDQFVAGLHAVAPLSRSVDFVPSADLGFGDDAFTFALNGDVRVNVAPLSKVKPYVGAGITWYNVNPSTDGVATFSETGASLLGGMWLNRGGGLALYLEGRIGLGDVPDFKALVGFNW
ncbi:MAG: hypothetical protein ABI960_06915 [Candidatus Eisenbacteria bacterium]